MCARAVRAEPETPDRRSRRGTGASVAGRTSDTFVFAGFVLYGALALYAVRYGAATLFFPVAFAGMLGAAVLYRSVSVFLELSLLLFVGLVAGETGHQTRVALSFALVAAVMLYAGHRSLRGRAAFIAVPLALLWLFLAGFDPHTAGVVPLLLVVSALPGFAILARNTLGACPRPPKDIDLILCSNSGHTAHFAGRFTEGAAEHGARSTVHRFHRLREFHPELSGDALVVAFPVYGWKPPWPFAWYLLTRLPRGGGKPAFILYTSAGGPENAGMVAWALLTLRGYRVVGRTWCVYPMNIPTFRLGPARVWRFLDHSVPPERDLAEARRCGAEFALGTRTGVPFVLWPFPLVVAGVLLDNPLINTVLVRNHVLKRRCVKCGLCVQFCPVERLRMEEYPKARGTCSLCMGCVNLCPTRAMHLFGWTEYGRQYTPRWPELLAGIVPKPKDGCA
jgi:ferredoxin